MIADNFSILLQRILLRMSSISYFSLFGTHFSKHKSIISSFNKGDEFLSTTSSVALKLIFACGLQYKTAINTHREFK